MSRREAFFVKQLYDTRDISAKDAVGILNALKEKGEISNQDLRKLGFDAKDEAGDRITLMYKLAQFETSIKEIEHLESEQRSNDLIFVFALLQGSSSTKSVTINGRKFTEKDVKALSSSVKGTSSTAQQLEEIANKANQTVPGQGTVPGTLKHSEFAKQVKGLNNPLLQAEVTYKNGQLVPYGTKGGVRLDVVEYNVDGTIKAVYDLKTGKAGLTTSRIQEILNHLPNNAPVYEIRPK